ncbi:hypothetical protein REPUB_Repub08aG0211800 [Reevesia pubescens]
MLSSDDFSNSNSLLVNNIMRLPTKTATCSKEKAVLVTVYVEKQRRRAPSNHHYQLHHTIKQAAGKGYNRRAELLHYSQRLRDSARSAASTHLQSKPVSSNDQQPSNETITVERKPKYSKTPACFDRWGILIPSFLRSLMTLQPKKTGKQKKNVESTSSNNMKVKAVMKSLQMQKKWRFFSKPISMLHNYR